MPLRSNSPSPKPPPIGNPSWRPDIDVVDVCTPSHTHLGDNRSTPELLAQVRAEMGLDRPFHVQYRSYTGGVLQGDFGRSLNTNRPDRRRHFSRADGCLRHPRRCVADQEQPVRRGGHRDRRADLADHFAPPVAEHPRPDCGGAHIGFEHERRLGAQRRDARGDQHAGGGSIAWIDDGGMLRVGPRSAGVAPGPVGYGRGGVEPTVTDANLVLGWLSADNFLGGELALDGEAARTAIAERCAAPLGLDVVAAAHAIVEIANTAMAYTTRFPTTSPSLRM
jgi:hypothetical protein